MKKFTQTSLFFLLALLFMVGCKSKTQKGSGEATGWAAINKAIQPDAKIKLSFSTNRKTGIENLIEVNALLINQKEDSVFFFDRSCEGTQHLLEFDTANFKLSPVMHCNELYAWGSSIPPKGKYEFKAYLEPKNEVIKDLELGFDFYELSAKYGDRKLEGSDLVEIQDVEASIIWAEPQKLN